MSDDKQSFFVESPDGRKFKMVIRGDLGRLSVSKIRRYLGNYGVPDDCFLFYKGVPLANDMVGDDFDLQNNGVLQIGFDSPSAAATEEEKEDEMHDRGSWPVQPQRGAPQQQQQQQQPSTSPTRNARQGAATATAAPLRSQEAWPHRGETSPTAEEELRHRVAQLEAEKAELERKVHRLSSAAAAAGGKGASPKSVSWSSAHTDPFDKAKENLRVLSEDLKLPLQFDANGTCVLNGESRGTTGLGDGLSLFISYDAQTQRVVLYTTLLTQLPLDNPPLLHKLYEVLLEGALLGREVCGGGVGISKDGGLVVLQTSFSAIHCDATLLRDTVPVFVETVRRWRSLVDELVA